VKRITKRTAGLLVLAALGLVLAGFLFVGGTEALHDGEENAFRAGRGGEAMLIFAIAAGTLVSEDLAGISAGLLASAGKLELMTAILASFTGIFIGDTLIYGLGFFYGRPLLVHRWARWLVREEAIDRAQGLFRRHGIWIVLLTRFIPGTRTATYFSAGALHAPFLPFLLVFAIAAALWTPLLVGLSYLLGRQLLEFYRLYESLAIPALIFSGLLVYLGINYILPLATWKGRRRLRGKWMRATQWEFWPLWQVNWLVFLYVVWTGLFRYRNPLLFTAVNPGMPHGGVIGESKTDILDKLGGASSWLPRWSRISEGPVDSRLKEVEAFLESASLDWPVVLKPDEGQRGRGVIVAGDADRARAWFETMKAPCHVQEYVAGNEYGVFYVRPPGESRGRVTSVTVKRQMSVIGDGEKTLESLIHAHPRAIALLDILLDRFRDRLHSIPAAGETVRLGELGTHALGAVFLDGNHLITPALEETVHRIAENWEGFHFGRFDLKAPDEEALKRGEGLRVIELNGVTSEPVHIYDPRHSLFYAWKTLCRHWRMAFEIASANKQAGSPVSGFGEFLRDIPAAFSRQRMGN